jgi:hypothetical protein
MDSVEAFLKLPRQQAGIRAALRRMTASHRVRAYLACTALAVVCSFLLGKEMRWDTLDYHFYAGFSALHDRFAQDYFPAGSQTYFNPYAYAPFYLLATSGLPALAVASIFAVVHSAILWLSYELALEIVPRNEDRTRLALGACAVALTFANPILINQFGSSYADITTAELVLAGWLLLIRAVRSPRPSTIIYAACLLGTATALKVTNSVHALSGMIVLLFLPIPWYRRFRCAIAFGVALAMSFAIVTAPWAIHLEQHFGNPVFPLLNNIFRSPEYPTATMMDYRFVPDSLSEALWRPFAIVAPLFTVDDELQAPDLRYALVVVAAILLLVRLGWERLRRSPAGVVSYEQSQSTRALTALGCGLLVDWTMWLRASGNGRYFLAMSCVAAVVGVALVFRALAPMPKLRNWLLVAVFSAQVVQLCTGTDYRDHVAWDGEPWFEVSVPAELAAAPALYLSYGVQSNSFVVPFLPPGSGFVNLGGDFPLVRQGVNGERVESLVQRYAPNLRMLAPELQIPGDPHPVISVSGADDAMELFGLRADTSDCVTIVVPDAGPQPIPIIDSSKSARTPAGRLHGGPLARLNTEYLASCRVVPHLVRRAEMAESASRADLIFDRLEDACPQLFQPGRPVTVYYGRKDGGQIWARRYLNTNLTAWISSGWVHFIDPTRGGPAQYVGSVRDFEKGTPRIACGRRDERYYARLTSISPAH